MRSRCCVHAWQRSLCTKFQPCASWRPTERQRQGELHLIKYLLTASTAWPMQRLRLTRVPAAAWNHAGISLQSQPSHLAIEQFATQLSTFFHRRLSAGNATLTISPLPNLSTYTLTTLNLD